MTTINIGTNKGNICNVKVNKNLNDIRYSDVANIVELKYQNEKGVIIYGWAEVLPVKDK